MAKKNKKGIRLSYLRRPKKKKIIPKTKKKIIKKVVKKDSKFGYKGDSKLIKEIAYSSKKIEDIKKEIRKVVIGQDKVINDLITCLICNGSALLEGVPGIAKTLIMKSLANSTGCSSKRIQFTADLLPTDITGFVAYSRQKGFFVVKGPIFANFILADEINRSPPKVQSAMIEAMQEKQVTIGKKTYFLDKPFIVFATENPLETRGVYKLPEAQVDRFLFKIIVNYPEREEEELIMDSNINIKEFKDYNIKSVIKPTDILKIQEIVKRVYVHPKIKKYITQIVEATRPSENNESKTKKYVMWGASPRASINLYIAARANALLNKRAYVTPQDIKDVAYNVLRHRIILNYQGQIDNIKTEDIIKNILNKIKVP